MTYTITTDNLSDWSKCILRIGVNMARKETRMSMKVDGWTESRYWSFIRSLLRRGVSKYPAKFKAQLLARRNSQRGGYSKWEYQCAGCDQWFLGKNVIVDHKEPAGTLRCYEDLPGFVERLYCSPEDLQIMCKPCHDIKTYSERYGVSLAEAGNSKIVIARMNLPAAEQIKELRELGFKPDQISNAAKRKECYDSLTWE